MELSGLVVFVTGANREKGIGRACVVEAIKRGASKVYATARRVDDLTALADQFGDKVVPVELDVTNPEQIERIAELASDTNVLLNNSGVCAFTGVIERYDAKAARQEMEVNYFGPLQLIHAFAPHLIRNKPAAIINISSTAGLLASPNASTYSASKAAVRSITDTVRVELKPHGVAVIGVYPGPLETSMIEGWDIEKGSPAFAAGRIFDGLSKGADNVTTDSFSDHFHAYFKDDPEAVRTMKSRFEALSSG